MGSFLRWCCHVAGSYIIQQTRLDWHGDMMTESFQKAVHFWGNVLGLFILSSLLIFGFYLQIAQNQLPCPLCLLQRVMFVAVGVTMMFNLQIEIRARHYGLMMLAAIAGLSISVRQVLLHIVPGDPGFGLPFLGLHIYTWSAVIFFVILLCSALAMLFDRGFHKVESNRWLRCLCMLFLAVILTNAFSALLECGFGQCPDDPERYLLYDKLFG